MFWGPATLKRRIKNDSIITPYDPDLVGRANYTLSVGEQAYVTPTATKVKSKDRKVKSLTSGNGIVIPSGQFSFILTQEIVKVPDDAIAFISMRVRYKNRGLVNVSGFHVDPGWEGKLIFAVFNAGPADITVHHGDPYFHIWFADIDSKVAGTPKSWDNKISADLINNIGQPIISLKVLQDRLDELERKQSLIRLILTGAIALLAPLAAGVAAGLALSYFGDWSLSKNNVSISPSPQSTTQKQEIEFKPQQKTGEIPDGVKPKEKLPEIPPDL